MGCMVENRLSAPQWLIARGGFFAVKTQQALGAMMCRQRLLRYFSNNRLRLSIQAAQPPHW